MTHTISMDFYGAKVISFIKFERAILLNYYSRSSPKELKISKKAITCNENDLLVINGELVQYENGRVSLTGTFLKPQRISYAFNKGSVVKEEHERWCLTLPYNEESWDKFTKNQELIPEKYRTGAVLRKVEHPTIFSKLNTKLYKLLNKCIFAGQLKDVIYTTKMDFHYFGAPVNGKYYIFIDPEKMKMYFSNLSWVVVAKED